MDQSLPRYEPNTDAFGDRAALVLQGSVGLTCARGGRPLGLRSKAECSPCQPPAVLSHSPSISAHWPSRDLLHFSHLHFSLSNFLILPCYADPVLLRIPLARLIPVQLKAVCYRIPVDLSKLHSTDAPVNSAFGMIKKKRKRPVSFEIGVWLKLA